MKEVLEVAYISRVMSKNFRKEGQPEKERISQVTGIDLEKVCHLDHFSPVCPHNSQALVNFYAHCPPLDHSQTISSMASSEYCSKFAIRTASNAVWR